MNLFKKNINGKVIYSRSERERERERERGEREREREEREYFKGKTLTVY